MSLGLICYPFLFDKVKYNQFGAENAPLINSQFAAQSVLTIVIIALVAITGYVLLRFYPLKKMPPLLAVCCISALYLGIGECVLWFIQILSTADFLMIMLYLLPINIIIIFLRTIRDVVYETILLKKTEETIKCTGLLKFLNHTLCWPVIAFVGAVPLLGIIIIILLVFGQEPDSIIKAWTQTADWTMSQKIPPQNIHADEHYLCTVAAGGHRKVVKPIRTGERHGHRVVVNRQLCVANAFEQLIQERTPRFHRAVRGLYDKTGYPIAKHIHSPYLADVIYFVMKPLEWLFLAVLYMFDTKPENRIAVQYPHSKPPIIEHVK